MLGNVCRSVTALVLPPLDCIVYSIVIRDIASIYAQNGRIFCQRRDLDRKEGQLTAKARVMLVYARSYRNRRFGIRDGYGKSVLSVCREKRVERHPGREARLGHSLSPACAQKSFVAHARAPGRIYIYARKIYAYLKRLGDGRLGVARKHLNVAYSVALSSVLNAYLCPVLCGLNSEFQSVLLLKVKLLRPYYSTI